MGIKRSPDNQNIPEQKEYVVGTAMSDDKLVQNHRGAGETALLVEVLSLQGWGREARGQAP